MHCFNMDSHPCVFREAHVHFCDSGTPRIADSMCLPHPPHVVFLHFRHVVWKHMCCDEGDFSQMHILRASYPPARGVVTVVTKDGCTYCVKAKDLLTELGIPYVVVDFHSDMTPAQQEHLRSVVPTKLTFPQIFLGEDRVDGGHDGLRRLAESGTLDDALVKGGVSNLDF